MRSIFQEFWDASQTAVRSIASHKMRAILTTLGIVIGITSVTSMATVINGIERQFDQTLSELGTDVLYVEKWPWVQGPGTRWWEYANRPDVKADLANVIGERSRLVAAVAPVISTSRPVTYQGTTVAPVTITASTADYPRVHAVDVASGRFFTEMEDRTARNVAVIGAHVAERLFALEDPLGKYVRISGQRFQVIGVLERRGSGPDQPQSVDQAARIPFRTFAKIFGVERRSVSIQARVADPTRLEDARDELTGILRAARRVDAMQPNNFEINEHEAMRRQLAPVKLVIYGIGLFLTALALLVGGIGVMNIMFVSVKERTREIGLRKAVGAPRRSILLQFLVEAVVVCLIGGVIGVVIASGFAALINVVFTAYLPVGTVALAFALCVLIGIFFGLAPAWAAAKSDPIESLRYE